ncbi:MAG: N-acetyl-gamma-glutamyl-phosphate reductase [Chloroherpetonaceae bacterium]|nr:N-acetyl-gamma-glutamyl-phosphate reductase [Chloroherpetonaceae bacterium]
MSDFVSVSIVGASGYSGAELVQIFLRHSGVRIHKLFANASAGKHFAELYPRFRGQVELTLEPYSLDAACESQCVFLALPSGEAMHLVPELLLRGKKVIDLGGDFRLKEATQYERFYKHTHAAPNLLSKAIYGLTELNRAAIKNATLLANPGCYPTSIILPLVPLLKAKLIEPERITVVSMSGVSGAGRSASIDLHFCEVSESVKAYKVSEHQHLPEIEQALQEFSGQAVSVSFVPHLIPIVRGIYTTIHATLSRNATEEEIEQVYAEHYAGEPFVRFSKSLVPHVKGVAHTNCIDIGFKIRKGNEPAHCAISH